MDEFMKRRNFINEFLEMQEKIDHIFDNFFRPVRYTDYSETEVWQPPTDIYETVDTFIVKMELPGIQPREDIKVVLEGNRLIVEGNRTDRTQTKKEHYHQDEINYGPFYRLIQLPDVIDEEAVPKANYKNGFLEIVLLKKRAEHKSVVIESKENDQEKMLL